MDGAPSTLDRFLADWSRRRRVTRALWTLCVWGAPLLLASLAVGLVMPGWSTFFDTVAVVLVVGAVGWEIARTRPDGRRVDREFALGDRMRTVLEVRRRDVRPALLAWLERDVAARIAAAGGQPTRRPARLGPLRWAAWALSLALMLKLLAFLAPPGRLQLASAAGGAGVAIGGAAQQQPSESGSGGDQEEASEQQPDEPPPPDDPPEPDDPEQPEAPPDQESDRGVPEPLLDDLPEQRDFAAPQFIGEGPSDTVTAPAAALDEVSASAGAAPPPPAGVGTEAQQPDAPAEPRVDFERAREEALRARHVREDERAFVRAWFDRLVGSERKR